MKYGIFCSIDGRNAFLDESSEIISFKLIRKNNIYQLEFRNLSDKAIYVNSAMLELYLDGETVLEHGWLQCSDVFFRKADEYTRQKKVFMMRDQNPMSFMEDYGYLKKSIVSEWFTLISGKTCHLIGAVTTHDQFSQIFVKKEKDRLRTRITCQFDGIIMQKNKTFRTEKIAVISGNEEVVKIKFNSLIRKHMGLKKRPKPISGVCCAYYWNGKSVNETICHEELDSLNEKGIDIDYFQIDDGYVKVGDWIDYKKQFPSGFGPIIKKAKEYGYKPGIWISPFIAYPGSELFHSHPDWFLKENGKFLGRKTSPLDSFPGLNFKVLDPTNNEFRKYLRKVLLHFKKIGFEFFKIDFLNSVCMVRYENRTRAEAFSDSIKFIRKILGNETYILSGITQLSPLVGIVDSANVPILKEIGNQMLIRDIRACELRKHLDFWAPDPDCIVFKHGLDRRLIEKQIGFIKQNNACVWIGDKVSDLDDGELMRLRELINK
jgi:hypothetical protein